MSILLYELLFAARITSANAPPPSALRFWANSNKSPQHTDPQSNLEKHESALQVLLSKGGNGREGLRAELQYASCPAAHATSKCNNSHLRCVVPQVMTSPEVCAVARPCRYWSVSIFALRVLLPALVC